MGERILRLSQKDITWVVGNEQSLQGQRVDYTAALNVLSGLHNGREIVAPEVFSQFPSLVWTVTTPKNKSLIMYGHTEDSSEEDYDGSKAIGTIASWNGNIHIAGLTDGKRIVAAKYIKHIRHDEEEREKEEHVLRRLEASLKPGELTVSDKCLTRIYSYFSSEKFIDRPVFPTIPSSYDYQTRTPFQTAGLVTQEMASQACGDGQEPISRLLTLHHTADSSCFERVTRGLLDQAGIIRTSNIDDPNVVYSIKGEPLVQLPSAI